VHLHECTMHMVLSKNIFGSIMINRPVNVFFLPTCTIEKSLSGIIRFHSFFLICSTFLDDCHSYNNRFPSTRLTLYRRNHLAVLSQLSYSLLIRSVVLFDIVIWSITFAVQYGLMEHIASFIRKGNIYCARCKIFYTPSTFKTYDL